MSLINLNLRDTRRQKETPINIVVRWNGQRLVYPSAFRIEPRYWSTKSQSAKSGLPGHITFNLNLKDRVKKVATAHQQFLLDNDQRQPTVTELRERIDAVLNPPVEISKGTLFGFIDEQIMVAALRMESGELSGGATLSKYETTRKHLTEFCKAKRFPLDYDTVDKAFYLQFIAFLTKDKKLAQNTVGKYIRTLKTFLNAALDEDPTLMPRYRSRTFKAPSEPDSGKVSLSGKELTDLFNLDLRDNKRLEQIRDLFIVGAWTGLRFSDWSSITPEHITGDRIRIDTVKTGQKVTIPMHACVRAILSKYDKVLPRVISNQKTNAYLKEMTTLVPSLQEPITITGTVAGKPHSETKAKGQWVSTHTARRSFATNAYRGDGYSAPIPVPVIMGITGHRTEKQFMVYIRMNADDRADEFEKYMDKVAPLAIAR